MTSLIDPVPVLVGDEVDGNPEMSVATTSSDSVKVGLRVFGEVEVDDDVDGGDVNTTSEEICGVTGFK